MMNGWLVDYGKQCKPPIAMPRHERMIYLVKARTEERLKQLEEIEAKGQEMSLKDKGRDHKTSSTKPTKAPAPVNRPHEDTQAEEVRLDKYELRKKRKAEARREKLGKQPLPDSYAAPKILAMGNKALSRK